MVTPSYMLALIDEMERQGMDPYSARSGSGFSAQSPGTQAMRETIERRAGIDAVDIYGLSEFIGPASPTSATRPRTGWTCGKIISTRRSSTPTQAKCCPTVTRRTGGHLTDQRGAAGHPLSHARPHEAVPPTARTMLRMDNITGHTDDMLTIRGVNVFPSQIEELICKTRALAPHYLLIADKDGHLDT